MTTPTQTDNLRLRDAEGNEYQRASVLNGGAHMPINADFFTEVAKGNVPGHSLIHKFGAGLLTTDIKPITLSTYFRTPIVGEDLEVLSSDAGDNPAGAGGHRVTIDGLVEGTWVREQEEVVLNGTTPVALTKKFVRVFSWYVSLSGTYATQDVGSHLGTLTLRVAGGGDTWSTISADPFPLGQSEVGLVTIPKGYTGFLYSKNVFVDTTKTANVYFFQRSLADDTIAPYTGTMRLFEKEIGVKGAFGLATAFPKGGFVGPCDIGFMGKVSQGTADCSVEFEILLVEDSYL